jgi:flagellar basal-body rod protein FlgB
MPIEGIFNNTIELLSKGIDLRAKNHNHISANLANAETPNYIPTSVTSHPRHIPLKGQAGSIDTVQGTVVKTPAPGVGRDGNAVEMEQEMSKLASNQIMYNASVQLIAKKFEGLKLAIKGQ